MIPYCSCVLLVVGLEQLQHIVWCWFADKLPQHHRTMWHSDRDCQHDTGVLCRLETCSVCFDCDVDSQFACFRGLQLLERMVHCSVQLFDDMRSATIVVRALLVDHHGERCRERCGVSESHVSWLLWRLCWIQCDHGCLPSWFEHMNYNIVHIV